MKQLVKSESPPEAQAMKSCPHCGVARGGIEEHVLNSLSKSWEGMVQMMVRQHEALLHRNAELEKACDKLMEHCRTSDDECDRQRRIIDTLTATTGRGGFAD